MLRITLSGAMVSKLAALGRDIDQCAGSDVTDLRRCARPGCDRGNGQLLLYVAVVLQAVGYQQSVPASSYILAMHMEISLDQNFVKSTLDLGDREGRRVWKAIDDFCSNPQSPGLRLENLKGSAGSRRLCSIRASDELRLLMAREGSTYVFLRAGHHDPIYRLANESGFVVPHGGVPSLIQFRRSGTTDATPERDVSPQWSVPETPPCGAGHWMDHWSDDELRRCGLATAEVSRVRGAARLDDLLNEWPDIPPEKLDLVVECCECTPDDWFQRKLDLAVQDRDDLRFRDAIRERGALAGLSSLFSPEELERLLSAPIEDWMIFLHPDQRVIVEREYSGPARVRGSAGTGKTVVALHRAAHLANRYAPTPRRREDRILFTTFISTLPPVLQRLYGRLPNAINGAVEFINIDRLAYRICSDFGQRPRFDVNATTRAFNEAFQDVVRHGTPLQQSNLTKDYLRNEVTAVIKGRGVASLEEYLKLVRTGRRMPFTSAMREQVWELREAWDIRLRDAGIMDFGDAVSRARELILRRSQPMYRAAIVDEAQDLTLEGLRLIRALVNGSGDDRRDNLFIVGDGAQKIYPGGYTLGQAGLDVRGNSAVLRVNYRNSRQIIAAAMASTGGESVDDLGDRYMRGDEVGEATRDEGVRPFLVLAGRFPDQVAFAAQTIKRRGQVAVQSLDDVGIFVPTNELVTKTIRMLNNHELLSQNLTEFDGQAKNRIKVGTFHRAKGLEFKIVFLLEMSDRVFPRSKLRWQSPEEYEEQRSIQISELFVAMTRARDQLFIAYGGEPSSVLYEAIDYFEPETFQL